MRRLAFLLTPIAVVALSALSLIPLPPPEPPTYPSPTGSPLPAITVLSVGDSLTYGTDGSATASYRGELSRLMRFTGQPHQWRVEAVPGTKCAWWAARIDAIITAHHPDVLFLNCGTNDQPGDATEADYRTILSVATGRGVQVVASLIGIPDMRSDINRSRPWIDDWMLGTNEAIKRALASYPLVPFANLERIPANPERLQSDGIHWNSWTEAAVGQLFYEAAQRVRPGWRTFDQMRITRICGLNGSHDTEPWPRPDVDYRVCRN